MPAVAVAQHTARDVCASHNTHIFLCCPSVTPQTKNRLAEDVRRFAEYLTITPQEVAMRIDLVGRVRRLVRTLWPAARIDVFGSFATGLCLPTSDLDFVVTVDCAFDPLPTLERALQRSFGCQGLEAVRKARVPVIKFRDGPTKVSVDVSFNTDNGPRNSALVRRLLARYSEARPLVLLLKWVLYNNCQNEVFYGGLGSYALVLMVVSFLQMRHRTHKAGSEDLGALLLGFLQLYGHQFNYERVGISVRRGGSYFVKEERGWEEIGKPYLLAIEDPDNPGLQSITKTNQFTNNKTRNLCCWKKPENNVGKGTYNIMAIRALFGQLYDTLVQPTDAQSPLSAVLTVHPQLLSYRTSVARRYHATTTTPEEVLSDSPRASTAAGHEDQWQREW